MFIITQLCRLHPVWSETAGLNPFSHIWMTIWGNYLAEDRKPLSQKFLNFQLSMLKEQKRKPTSIILLKTVLISLLSGCSDITAAVTQSQRADLLTGRAAKSGAKPKQTTKRKKNTATSKKGGKAEDSKEDHLAAIGGRDTSLFLFRALGKILYCKRE